MTAYNGATEPPCPHCTQTVKVRSHCDHCDWLVCTGCGCQFNPTTHHHPDHQRNICLAQSETTP